MGANLNPIKSLFLTGLYSVASIIPLAIITSGGKSMAQRIPDRCTLPRSFVNQPLPRGGGQPAPVQPDWPTLLELFRNADAPIQTRPSGIPVSPSVFEGPIGDRMKSYELGPGDQIFIDVFINGQRSQELTIPNATIGPQGSLAMPLIGLVELEGLTLEQVRQNIQPRLAQFVRNPEVVVSLVNQRPVQVTVTGKIARPGFYPLASPQLIVALTTAGGTRPGADLRRITVRRTLPTGQTLETEIDLFTPLLLGLEPPNIRLSDRDVITVPTQEVSPSEGVERDLLENYSLAAAPVPAQVTVVGEVVQPGFYTLPAGGSRVSTALLAAGGATLTADLRTVLVCRTTVDGRVLEDIIDLYTPLAEATSLPDVSLSNGDSVIVLPLDPDVDERDYDRKLVASSTLVNQQITVRILSYAGNAIGAVALPNGSTFIDILANVPLQTGDLDKIALIRYDRQSRQTTTQILNGKNVLRGDQTDNILLQDEDVIVINRNLITQVTVFLNNFTQPFRDVLGFTLFFQQLINSAERLFGPDQQQGN
ncbi:MAG: polysaccharide biosynthesis/export family protein [Arthrospira platensis PCC 7345]|uniref:polysaccharide biosynthesis/export family protein n=1 Tax=Limnospira platensis TaxID=118562 RepID=UPI0028E15F8B|nr:polysaccharide biosynthesis/export family protein [Arthrospira platensis PCC 7345]